MSTDERVGRVPAVELPEEFGTTTSWERAQREHASLSRVSRAEWMVRVGGGDLHRVTFVLEEGHMLGECDCRGYQHHDWCAHLAALVLAYVQEDVQPADLSTPVSDEVDALWSRSGRDGGEHSRR
jgi:hypothetical protein